MGDHLRYRLTHLLHNGAHLIHECAECEFCEGGTTPVTKTVTVTGVIAKSPITCTTCSEVNRSYILTRDALDPCKLSGAFELSCGTFNVQLTFLGTINSIDMGFTGEGNANFQETGLANPRNCNTSANGTYTFQTDGSTQCDFSGATVVVS